MRKITLIISFFILMIFFCSDATANTSHLCKYFRLKKTIAPNKKNIFIISFRYLRKIGPLRYRIYRRRGTAFVVDKKRGLIATARHVFPKRPSEGYIEVNKKNKIKKIHISKCVFHEYADLAICKVKYHFTSEVKLSFSYPISPDLLYYIGYPYVIKEYNRFEQVVVIGNYFKKIKLLISSSKTAIYYLSIMPALGGASGSPVFNFRGEVIGITTFIYRFNKYSSSFTAILSVSYLRQFLYNIRHGNNRYLK